MNQGFSDAGGSRLYKACRRPSVPTLASDRSDCSHSRCLGLSTMYLQLTEADAYVRNPSKVSGSSWPFVSQNVALGRSCWSMRAVYSCCGVCRPHTACRREGSRFVLSSWSVSVPKEPCADAVLTRQARDTNTMRVFCHSDNRNVLQASLNRPLNQHGSSVSTSGQHCLGTPLIFVVC